MEAAVADGVGVDRTAGSTPTTPLQARKCQKRKRRHSGGPWEGRHGRGGRKAPYKKAKLEVSSTRAANNIMKFRLGGSVSDPLNLAGGDDVADNCSTCAPSPATPTFEDVGVPDLPPELQKDPLNLEGKVKNFPLSVAGSGAKSGSGSGRGSAPSGGQRKKPRRRTTSGSKPDSSTSTEDKDKEDKGRKVLHKKTDGRFCYGNYNRYYGYRNEGGALTADPRLALLHKAWFEGKDCLDIGCNTGQVTVAVAQEFNPNHIVGLDIDHTLIKTAWKNLNRLYLPSCTPDGTPFPASLTMTQGFKTIRSAQMRTSGCGFPHNISFEHGNYMSDSDAAAQESEYDVILALSLTKWIHLNFGDSGIRRFFKKVYSHLRPGGRFIVEPQPFCSYSRRKRINETIYGNYKNISFYPQDFHNYLMSPEVGFSQHLFLGTSAHRTKGFQRPLHIYTKATPSSSSDSSSLSQVHQPRLKSVVVVCSNAPSHSSHVDQSHPHPISSYCDLPHPYPGSSHGDLPYPYPIPSHHMPHPHPESSHHGLPCPPPAMLDYQLHSHTAHSQQEKPHPPPLFDNLNQEPPYTSKPEESSAGCPGDGEQTNIQQ